MSVSPPRPDQLVPANLLELLQSSSGTVPRVIAGSMVAGVDELSERCHKLREGIFKPLYGRSVSLLCGEVVQFLVALVALDGWASAIFLSTPGEEEDALTQNESSARCEFRVTTLSDGISVVELKSESESALGDRSLTHWIIATSGTTGVPKLVVHTFETLTRKVKRQNGASADLRWGLLYDPARFAGLQVLLQAFAGGGTLIVPQDHTDLEGAMALLIGAGCNALSATPSLWRKLTMTKRLADLPLKIVTLGGEPADAKILDHLRKQFPSATIRHIYASTEAGVGFSVADDLPGFPVSFLSEPPPGMSLCVRSDGMLMLKPDQQGPEFLKSSESISNEAGWIESGDLVELKGDRYLFLGRANGSVNVGGRKVHPSAVERVLLQVEGVQEARVYSKANPILGAVVAADVVAGTGIDPADLRNELLSHCRASLERFEIPAFFKFVSNLEITSTGKIRR
ncbi:MAG: class I adenylate-forming enzyme family protein [Luteolibacter sp.]